MSGAREGMRMYSWNEDVQGSIIVWREVGNEDVGRRGE